MFRMISLLLLTVMGDAASSDDPMMKMMTLNHDTVSYDKKDQQAFTLIY